MSKEEEEVGGDPSISSLPPNTHRVFFRRVANTLPREHPSILQEVMNENDYITYLERIEKPFIFASLIRFVPIPALLLLVASIGIMAGTGKGYLGFLLFLSIFCLAGSVFIFITQYDKKFNEAEENAGVILKEINGTCYSRGIMWTYHMIRKDNGLFAKYIEIVSFTPGQMTRLRRML